MNAIRGCEALHPTTTVNTMAAVEELRIETRTGHDITLANSKNTLENGEVTIAKASSVKAAEGAESAIEEGIDAESVFSEDLGGATLSRRLTNDEHTSVPKPGDVRINVKGAFIVEDDEEPGTPEEDFDGEGYQLERRGIRLPNHKAVVSHIAVDVRSYTLFSGQCNCAVSS